MFSNSEVVERVEVSGISSNFLRSERLQSASQRMFLLLVNDLQLSNTGIVVELDKEGLCIPSFIDINLLSTGILIF